MNKSGISSRHVSTNRIIILRAWFFIYFLIPSPSAFLSRGWICKTIYAIMCVAIISLYVKYPSQINAYTVNTAVLLPWSHLKRCLSVLKPCVYICVCDWKRTKIHRNVSRHCWPPRLDRYDHWQVGCPHTHYYHRISNIYIYIYL